MRSDWHPTEDRIAFESRQDDSARVDMGVLDRVTKDTRRLTDDIFGSVGPTWSAGGAEVAFSTQRFKGAFVDRDICAVDVASGEFRQLTTSPRNDVDAVGPGRHAALSPLRKQALAWGWLKATARRR